MTGMMPGMSALARSIDKTTVRSGDAERAAIREMVRSAKERGLDITGPDGLLKLLTRTVLETALEEEMADHLGYDKHDPAGRDGGNSRNGTREKTVISDAAGAVTIEVPRDRDGSFTPVIVKKRQRRLGDVDKIVLSLYGKGMTTGEIPPALRAGRCPQRAFHRDPRRGREQGGRLEHHRQGPRGAAVLELAPAGLALRGRLRRRHPREGA
jgi:hypothetical protein